MQQFFLDIKNKAHFKAFKRNQSFCPTPVHSGVWCYPCQKQVHQRKNCALLKVLSTEIVLSQKCSPRTVLLSNNAPHKVLCALIVLSSKCSSPKKFSSQSVLNPNSALLKGISENLLYLNAFYQKKLCMNKFVLKTTILKFFQVVATLHRQKYLFESLISKQIVPTFTISKAVFRKKCPNLF